jgi:hypothetical protein
MVCEVTDYKMKIKDIQLNLTYCFKRVFIFLWLLMKKLLPLTLFFLQIYFILYAVPEKQVAKEINPFWLFTTCLALSIYYLFTNTNTRLAHSLKNENSWRAWVAGAVLGGLAMGLLISSVKQSFTEYPDASKFSDVVPQIEALYTRLAAGKFPYYPLEQYSWHPFPVYMPIHWLPVAVTYMLHIDTRWIGMFLLVAASCVYGIYVWKTNANIIIKLCCLVLPAIGLWSFLRWASLDVAVSFELIIAAYYLILAAGLAMRSLPITILGIILCLLSRYTMVFWLPLFLILLWLDSPRKNSYLSWSAIAVSVLVIYIFPFYLHDPSILKTGIAYHNGAAIAEWVGYGDNHTSWSFESGLYFAPYIKQMFSGDMEHRVFMCRAIQASAMLAMMGLGLLLHKKFKDRINFYDLSLVMLFLFLTFFFMFSPLTYKYYFIPFIMVSAVVTSKIILLKRKDN